MRKTFAKYMAVIMITVIGLAGCGGKYADNTQYEEESDTSVSKEYGIFNDDYTGYLDECTGWFEYTSFVNQDYDNDKLIDRVYREYKENTEYAYMSCCHYRIEFGNGDVIDMDKNVPTSGFLNIKSADLNDDRQDEIIISIIYGASTDMRGAGDLAVYEKHGDVYEKAVLPFRESEEGYSQTVPIHYEVVREKRIKVSIEDEEYETIVPIDHKQWDVLSYSKYYDNDTQDSVVWDSYFLDEDGKTKLVCKVHLFDKWSNYGLFAVLRHENGKYVIDRWMRVNEEYDDTIREDSLWALEDYLLCCNHEMKAGRQPVSVGLWIAKGEYASEEELVPGGGVYGENFVGECYLLVTDMDGSILSKRDITQDFDGMGDRLNFPGSFEIIDKDYNQDSRPDFTIGTYGSSSTNIYALYTIEQNGNVKLLGRDIPNSSPGAFSAAFEEGDDKAFYVNIWDNAVGEERQLVYEWDEAEEVYREKDDK